PRLARLPRPVFELCCRRSQICLGHHEFGRLDALQSIGLFPVSGATEDSTLGYALGARGILIRALPLLELVDIPETTEGMIRQNARWYKGVLDDVRFLWESWRTRRSAVNLAQLCRRVGNKGCEWAVAARHAGAFGARPDGALRTRPGPPPGSGGRRGRGSRLPIRSRFFLSPRRAWPVETSVTQYCPSCSFSVIEPGPRVSLSSTFNPSSSTVTPFTLSSWRTVESPRNGNTRATSAFCAAGSSVKALSPTFTVTCTAATVLSSSQRWLPHAVRNVRAVLMCGGASSCAGAARADSRVKTATRRTILARCDDIGSPPRSSERD